MNILQGSCSIKLNRQIILCKFSHVNDLKWSWEVKKAASVHIKPFLLLWALYENSDATCDSANKELGHSVHYIIAMLETP